MEHYNIKIFGKVQGVFFRQSAKTMAEELQLKGWTANLPDDTVYIEAEGEKEELVKFLGWCNKGPERAKVTGVEYENGNIRNFSDFQVRREKMQIALVC